MPTLRQKVETYERLLHAIQLHKEVTMNNNRLNALLNNICAWSYAHRVGNGTLTPRQQNKLINEAFKKLI